MTSNYYNQNGSKIRVNGYYHKDGTYVSPHQRMGRESMCYPYDYRQGDSNPYSFSPKYPNNDLLGAAKFYAEKNIVKFVPNDKIYSYGENFARTEKLNDSWELFKVGSVDHGFNQEYVQKNGKMHNSLNDIGDEKLSKKVKARLYLEGTGMDDCRVFDMHENSSISQKIARSAEMSELLQKGLKMLKHSGYFPAKHIEFKTSDLYNTLHGANITGTQFDTDGNLFVNFEDLYNFDKNATSLRSMAGYKLQSEGKIKPFYIRMRVKIPKNELDKY